MIDSVPVLYSTGCPRCEILKKKLDEAGISYSVCDDLQKMEALGIEYAPVLAVEGRFMEFMTAIAWVNAQKEA